MLSVDKVNFIIIWVNLENPNLINMRGCIQILFNINLLQFIIELFRNFQKNVFDDKKISKSFLKFFLNSNLMCSYAAKNRSRSSSEIKRFDSTKYPFISKKLRTSELHSKCEVKPIIPLYLRALLAAQTLTNCKWIMSSLATKFRKSWPFSSCSNSNLTCCHFTRACSHLKI